MCINSNQRLKSFKLYLIKYGFFIFGIFGFHSAFSASQVIAPNQLTNNAKEAVDIIPTTAITASNDVLASNSTLPTLPNAYELLQKIEAQQLQIARLSDQLETLQFNYAKLLQAQTELQKNQYNSSQPPFDVEQISAQIAQNIYDDIYVDLRNQLKRDVSAKNDNGNPNDAIDINKLPSWPYLNQLSYATSIDQSALPFLSNIDIPANELSIHEPLSSYAVEGNNPLSKPDNISSGDTAYANAYLALKQHGADKAVEDMQQFIDRYHEHPRIANAHYWLGEFYLQQQPPNIGVAKIEFAKVIDEYKDYPDNNSQSKAFFRLAMFAKQEGDAELAKYYSSNLIAQYPDTKEAKLAKDIDW